VRSPEALLSRLQSIPRVSLGATPTPLDPLPRLSRELGRSLWIKRDDTLGPAGGGNKTRKLEYLLAEAQGRGARKVATFGGLQSNHARLTAASARLLGMEPHLFYFESRPPKLTGNLLLAELLGAEMHFLPFGGGKGRMRVETASRLAKVAAFARLGPHYFIPVGGHTWLGALGYVRAALEVDAQARERGIGNAWLVCAAGSGGTLAGLMAGLALCGSGLRPLGIDVGRLWKGFAASVAHLAEEVCRRLGDPRRFAVADVPLVEETYVGERYGLPSPAGQAALERLARSEGILLDPVYTAKAFGGLLDLAARSGFGTDEPIIFLHTGGLPALFATLG
jgi:D-cysteine desulfhydrase